MVASPRALPVSRRKCELLSVRVSRSAVLLRLWARVPVADSWARAPGRLPRSGNDGGPQGSRSRGFASPGGRPRRAQPPATGGVRGTCPGESSAGHDLPGLPALRARRAWKGNLEASGASFHASLTPLVQRESLVGMSSGVQVFACKAFNAKDTWFPAGE